MTLKKNYSFLNLFSTFKIINRESWKEVRFFFFFLQLKNISSNFIEDEVQNQAKYPADTKNRTAKSTLQKC